MQREKIEKENSEIQRNYQSQISHKKKTKKKKLKKNALKSRGNFCVSNLNLRTLKDQGRDQVGIKTLTLPI